MRVGRPSIVAVSGHPPQVSAHDRLRQTPLGRHRLQGGHSARYHAICFLPCGSPENGGPLTVALLPRERQGPPNLAIVLPVRHAYSF
jgi:hypothetical protein